MFLGKGLTLVVAPGCTISSCVCVFLSHYIMTVVKKKTYLSLYKGRRDIAFGTENVLKTVHKYGSKFLLRIVEKRIHMSFSNFLNLIVTNFEMDNCIPSDLSPQLL